MAKGRGLAALSCFSSTGNRKKEFPSRAAAQKFLRDNNQTNHQKEFLCPDCKNWHLATVR